MDLAEFLKARLDEDEAAAKAATAGPWEWDDRTDAAEWDNHGPDLMSTTATWMSPEGRGPYPTTVLCGYGHDAWGVSIEDGDKAFIGRHDPARALREIAAKRRMLEELDLPYLGEEHLMKLLAAVYSGHPDYQPGWKP